MTRKPKGDYAVGYRKPPQANQSRKASPAIPKGRPKGATSFAEAAMRELDTKVIVREDGRPVRLRKRDIIIKQMIGQALKGDKAAVKLLVALVEKAVPHAAIEGAEDPRTVEADRTDRDILAWYTAQNAGQGEAPSATEAGGST
jgi:hypothetical protein